LNELETDITRPNPKTYKTLKHLNKEIQENVSLNITDKNVWLNHFVELWTQKKTLQHCPNSNIYHRHNFTLDELNMILTECKNNNTPGEDLFNMEVSNYATLEFKTHLLAFFNRILNGQRPPESWNKAIVIHVYKKGDKNNQENYRDISLLNSGYKIYTKLFHHKLYTFYSNILTEEQNGFRKGRPCADGYFVLKIRIENNREYNIETHLAFVDIRKAFDTVYRIKLMDMIKNDGVSNQLITAIFNINTDNYTAI
jgi:hypothetical protein